MDEDEDDVVVTKDSNGNILSKGDTVIVIKDLKINGGNSVIKRGTKVKNITLEGDGEHIMGSGDGVKGVVLKVCFLKKA
ncbi:MAG: alkylphosphonate utilization protein [Candidatus Pacebacteria bacterium]|jgi:protein PhnA|nr:alkylphosphonate utilization protein [Candidatus Paceibacterota bacterium]